MPANMGCTFWSLRFQLGAKIRVGWRSNVLLELNTLNRNALPNLRLKASPEDTFLELSRIRQ